MNGLPDAVFESGGGSDPRGSLFIPSGSTIQARTSSILFSIRERKHGEN